MKSQGELLIIGGRKKRTEEKREERVTLPDEKKSNFPLSNKSF